MHVLEEHTARVHAIMFSPDGRTVASSSRDGTVRIWDTNIGVQVATLRIDDNDAAADVLAIAVSGDGEILAAGSGNGVIRLWDPATGTEIALLRGHTDAVAAVAFLPNGNLASGSADTTVRIWDLATGTTQSGYGTPPLALTWPASKDTS